MKREIPCRWLDGAFRPCGDYYVAKCNDAFGANDLVYVSAEHERDMVSHRKAFAVIRTAWLNLPESQKGMDYAVNADTLRKYALIVAGHCDLHTTVMRSQKRAREVAAFVGNLARGAHGYAIVEVERNVVRCFTPHSQSVRAMGADLFYRTMADVTHVCAGLIGVTADELEKMGRENREAA